MERRFNGLRALALAATVVLAACASDDKDKYVERPVDEIYNQAMDALEAGEYSVASGLFDEVERQHPYSVWATKAQLMAAFSEYQRNRYDDAVAALDRYIELHPSNKDVPYAHYLKGLCYYEQISDVQRDQKMTSLAMATFEDLAKRFPDSKYARDAQIKLDLTNDHLAGKEMAIGRNYLQRGFYLAAINRFRIVVEQFQTTTHVPEALHRLSEAYTALGLVDEARKTAAVLGHNYPGSEWYVDSYELVEGVKIRTDQEEDPWYKIW